MVHDEETHVSIEQHKRKFAGTVIVHDTGGFVSKSSETEDVGNRVVVYIANDVKVGLGVGDVINVDGRYEAGHDGSWTWIRRSMRGIFGVVLQSPLRGRFMCPFDLAGLGWRYLATAILERWGAPRRKPRRMAASNDDLNGLHRLWCISLTLFSFVVQW
jgi:hypothetical protein